MDFQDYNVKAAAEKGIEVTILSPGSMLPMKDEDGTVIKITLQGSDSQTWIDATAEEASQYASEEEQPPEVVEIGVKRVLGKATMSWTGNVELHGETLECTTENATKLYSEDGLQWIPQQLLAAVGNRRLLFLGLANG